MIRKDSFDFVNKKDVSLNEYIDMFKRFCYYFEYNYTDKEIELLKDLWVYNKLELNKNQVITMNKIMEVM
ncbi:MAG: hypothetical protein IKT40_06240 [Bacilli bacterium]|nr:hypothetical protein [Bacilli bacterium]